MATTAVHTDSDDDRETEGNTTSPLGTPGFTLGSIIITRDILPFI